MASTRKPERPLSVEIIGAGKVGCALARSLRARGATVTLRPARRGPPARASNADLLVLAARDRELEPLARALVAKGSVAPRTAVVHCAGALGPEPLAPLRGHCAGVGQMHPMISFADRRRVPSLARGQLHVSGDPAAVRLGRRVGRLLGMSPRTIPGLDRTLYHAAAGLLANGAAALAAVAAEVLEAGGVPKGVATAMLGPLLRSVADNVEALGLPAALTGPVRRGDAMAIARHLDILARAAPSSRDLYLAMARAQLPLARSLGDAPPEAFDEVLQTLDRLAAAPRPRARTRAR